MRVLVVGASGMLGSTMLRILSERPGWEVFGTIRSESVRRFFSASINARLINGVDVEHSDMLVKVLTQTRPDVVVNCAGLIKHRQDSEDPLVSIPLNSLMPHRLARLCQLFEARMIHVSTDCVFSGKKGSYIESDLPDARDVYGQSKSLGEVMYGNSITLRTSIIGHELQGNQSLLDWFLSQNGSCKGYTRAIFSGLPTVIFSQIVRDVVIPHSELTGLYHVAAQPINKFDLLKLIADVYGTAINIVPDDNLVIDRSLDATRFYSATGYVAPEWSELVKLMHLHK